MSLANGRRYLAIPGPSVVPDAVLAAMHRAAPNIYAGEVVDMAPGIVADLKRVAGTAHHAAIYIGNGHAAWEASLANVLSPGDEVLVLATGRFGLMWGSVAAALGVKCRVEDFGQRAPIDLARVAALLAEDRGHRIKAVLACHVDTATSIRNDVAALRAALDEAGHPALLMIDCIASLACDRYEMDAWGADVTVAACQKGLMTPPGLSFVFFNERADAAREHAACVTRHWDWKPRTRPEGFYQYFDGTAPTHHLYGLRTALDMIFEEGLEAVWARHERLAEAVWAAFEAWEREGPIELNVRDRAHRSCAVTALRAGAPNASELRRWLEEKTGVTLGIGLGMAEPNDPAWHGFFRIGHMGHVNAHMVLGVLGSIEAGLRALNLPHGEGGLDAAAEIVSRA